MPAWVAPAIIGASALGSAAIGAMGSGKKGGGSDVDYKWSDEQQIAWQKAQPWVNQRVDQSLNGPPQLGAPPPLYDIPDATGLTPTSGWYNSIAPEVKQGLWEPWNDAANQLQANLGVQGQVGSPLGGYSGAAGTGLGQLYADAGQQVGMQAWNMMQPGQQALWNANLGRNVTGYNTSLVPWQQNYQSSLQDWNVTQNLLSSMAAGQPTGIVSQQGNPWAGALSGAAFGGLTANSIFGNNNYGGGGGNNFMNPYTPFQTGTPNYTGSPVDQWQYAY